VRSHRLLLAPLLATLVASRAHAQAPEPAPAPAAEDQYAGRAIHYDLFMDRVVSVRQGPDGPSLQGGDLYRALERPDLLHRHQALQAARVALGVAGTLAVAGGLAYIFENACAATAKADGTRCDDRWSFAFGTGTMLLGGLALGLAIAPSWSAASPDELRAAADEHNRRLRERLGLAPLALRGGGGAALAGAF